MIFCKKAGWGMALLFLCLIFGTGRTQKIEAADTETDQAAAAQDELLAELDFDAIQQEVDSLLSSQNAGVAAAGVLVFGESALRHALPTRRCCSHADRE